jgi:hypothetical protein
MLLLQTPMSVYFSQTCKEFVNFFQIVLNELQYWTKQLKNFCHVRHWNFNSRVVCTVFEHRKDIIETMRKILNQSKNASTINQASGHLKILTSNSFVCWLNLFYKIMPHVDILFAKFQQEKLILLLPTKIYYHLKISYYRLEIISPNFPRPMNHQLQNDVRPISVRNTLEKQTKFVILLCVKSKNASALLAT